MTSIESTKYQIHGFPHRSEFVAIGFYGKVALVPIDQVPDEIISSLDDVDAKWLSDMQGYRRERIARQRELQYA